MRIAYFVPVLLVIITFSFTAKSQDISIKYISSKTNLIEVPKNKAKFNYSTSKFSDGKIEHVISDIKTGIIVDSEYYLVNEPIGKWLKNGKILDYNFELNRVKNTGCSDTLKKVGIENIFLDDDSLEYKAPVFSENYLSIQSFLLKNISYPIRSLNNGFEGTVVIGFYINESGKIENTYVNQSLDPLFDKEAMRVIRLLTFKNAPMLSNEFVKTCFFQSITFMLED